jgi:acyl-CoA thioester hydrolase
MPKPPNNSSGVVHFSMPARVYYEDTDAAGVVYYANYLKYFERCRSEWLRAIGHDQRHLAREHLLGFVVRSVTLDYLKPARLDDLLDIDLSVEKLGRAQIVFRQSAVLRRPDGDDVCVSGRIQVACVNVAVMKPAAIPGWLRTSLEQLA